MYNSGHWVLFQGFFSLVKIYRASVKVLEVERHEQIKCVYDFKQMLYFHLSLWLYCLYYDLLVCLRLPLLNYARLLCFHVDSYDNGLWSWKFCDIFLKFFDVLLAKLLIVRKKNALRWGHKNFLHPVDNLEILVKRLVTVVIRCIGFL